MRDTLLMIKKNIDRGAQRPLLSMAVAILVMAGLMLAPFTMIGLSMNTPIALMMHIATFFALAFFLVSLRITSLLTVIVLLVLLAFGLELIQTFSAHRNVGVKDIAANLAGVFLGIGAGLILYRKKK